MAMTNQQELLDRQEKGIQYSTVTSLRGKLLKIVNSFRKNPARRFLITKHGEPQAVLMSFQTYRSLRKMALEIEGSESGDPNEELEEAFARLKTDRAPHERTTPADIRDIRVYMEGLRRDLDNVMQEVARKKAVQTVIEGTLESYENDTAESAKS
jgi:prevent-host-death family protein